MPIRPYPETITYPAESAVLIFTDQSRPDRIHLVDGNQLLRDLPARAVTRLEAVPKGATFLFRVQHPDQSGEHEVTVVEMRLDAPISNDSSRRVDAVLAFAGEQPAWSYFVIHSP